MASVTVTTTRSGTGFVEPDSGVFGGVITSAQVYTSNGSVHSMTDMRPFIRYIASVSDGDTWDSSSTGGPPPKGAIAAFWQGDDVSADRGCAFVTSQGGPGANAAIEFGMENAASSGWVLVLSRG